MNTFRLAIQKLTPFFRSIMLMNGSNDFIFASSTAISKVPTVSILAAITGTPLHFLRVCLKINSLSKIYF
jgi:hypothetical protein